MYKLCWCLSNSSIVLTTPPSVHSQHLSTFLLHPHYQWTLSLISSTFSPLMRTHQYPRMRKMNRKALGTAGCVSLHEMSHSSVDIRRLSRLCFSSSYVFFCAFQQNILLTFFSSETSPVTPALFIINNIATTHTWHTIFARSMHLLSTRTLITFYHFMIRANSLTPPLLPSTGTPSFVSHFFNPFFFFWELAFL